MAGKLSTGSGNREVGKLKPWQKKDEKKDAPRGWGVGRLKPASKNEKRAVPGSGSAPAQGDNSWMKRAGESKHHEDMGGTYDNGATGLRGNSHREDTGGLWTAGGHDSEHRHKTQNAVNRGLVSSMNKHWDSHHKEIEKSEGPLHVKPRNSKPGQNRAAVARGPEGMTVLKEGHTADQIAGGRKIHV
jgi:hypothetical protein